MELFLWVFCDPTITKDEAGVRTELWMLFLHFHSWFGGRNIDDCPRTWAIFFQDLVIWLLLMLDSVIDF